METITGLVVYLWNQHLVSDLPFFPQGSADYRTKIGEGRTEGEKGQIECSQGSGCEEQGKMTKGPETCGRTKQDSKKTAKEMIPIISTLVIEWTPGSIIIKDS